MAAEDLPDPDIEAEAEAETFGFRRVAVTPEDGRGRIDKVLAALLPELSRARIQALIAQGQVSHEGAPISDASGKAVPGNYRVELPAPVAAEPQPEAIPLTILHEDRHLIVVDKPAGMAVHPAPGSETGTLVNALLHHCGASLSGIGGVARPGIVHRIDKDTSGIVVVAKTDAAHQGLSVMFHDHVMERVYVALARGAPRGRTGTIEGNIARSTADRKKMAIVKSGGRHAVTHYLVEKVFGAPDEGKGDKALASRLSCRLETGRTHQIRVHLASQGCPCLGDPVYGSGPPANAVKAAIAEAGLRRQALHAAVLGFVHPVTGEALRFESPLPADMATLEGLLEKL
jgi:23S rRNA pseudouridine1911/1915/1917 synthase